MRTCLFCDNPADTGEHAWPEWILNILQPAVIRGTIGGNPVKMPAPNAEVKINCVCNSCNSGWMSRLETASKPLIVPMMKDFPMPISLNLPQRFMLSLWAAKTAIVWEAVVRRFRDSRYPKPIRHGLRSSRLPGRTSVWLGRYTGGGVVGAFAHDSLYQMSSNNMVTDGYSNGYVCTLVVGRLALQLFTLHVPPEREKGRIGIPIHDGPWERLLIKIYPTMGGRTVFWPPLDSFSDIQVLANRWSLGDESSLTGR